MEKKKEEKVEKEEERKGEKEKTFIDHFLCARNSFKYTFSSSKTQ